LQLSPSAFLRAAGFLEYLQDNKNVAVCLVVDDITSSNKNAVFQQAHRLRCKGAHVCVSMTLPSSPHKRSKFRVDIRCLRPTSLVALVHNIPTLLLLTSMMELRMDDAGCESLVASVKDARRRTITVKGHFEKVEKTLDLCFALKSVV
jgi:hypothetical protein